MAVCLLTLLAIANIEFVALLISPSLPDSLSRGSLEADCDESSRSLTRDSFLAMEIR